MRTRFRTWSGLLLGLALVIGCQEPPPPESPSTTGQASPVDDLVLASARIALPPPGTAPSDLPDPNAEGAQLLRQYCTACHALSSPQTHSATDWPVVLRRMWLRTEGVAAQYDVPVPNAAERKVMLDYLLEYALEVSRSELPRGPGRALFVTNCSRCHELPDPSQHTETDWAAVVIRMRQHMVQMLRLSPPQAEVQEIILYLERASKAAS